MGGSYGGYMTMAAITLYPDLFAAAVNTVGIVNWETFLKNTSGYRRRQREVEYGMLDKDIDFLRRISPLAKVDKIKTPLFVIHGKNDPRVPYTEAEQVVKALKDARRNRSNTNSTTTKDTAFQNLKIVLTFIRSSPIFSTNI